MTFLLKNVISSKLIKTSVGSRNMFYVKTDELSRYQLLSLSLRVVVAAQSFIDLLLTGGDIKGENPRCAKSDRIGRRRKRETKKRDGRERERRDSEDRANNSSKSGGI